MRERRAGVCMLIGLRERRAGIWGTDTRVLPDSPGLSSDVTHTGTHVLADYRGPVLS